MDEKRGPQAGRAKRSRDFNSRPAKQKIENSFIFRNGLILTPDYETGFSNGGGIRYVRSAYNDVLLMQQGIYLRQNGILKIPVFEKRGINKHTADKKLVVEEIYDFDGIYTIKQNAVIYYSENRLDVDIGAVRKPGQGLRGKTEADCLTVHFLIPEIGDIIKYASAGENDRPLNSVLSRETTVAANPATVVFICEQSEVTAAVGNCAEAKFGGADFMLTSSAERPFHIACRFDFTCKRNQN